MFTISVCTLMVHPLIVQLKPLKIVMRICPYFYKINYGTLTTLLYIQGDKVATQASNYNIATSEMVILRF